MHTRSADAADEGLAKQGAPGARAKPAPASIMGRAFGAFEEGGEHGAAGPGYKARLTAETFEFTPVLGKRAPRNFPVAFSLESIRLGEATILGCASAAAPEREANRLRIVRGAGVTESYEARVDGVEVSWLFESLPRGTGDLVVRGRLTTELPVAPSDGTEEGIRFEALGLGGVKWGGVTGIDANGATAKGTLRLDGTHLEMALPGWFVERATFPLVLDPLVGSTIPFAGGNNVKPDIAYDAWNDVYLVVWERVVSGSDSDVLGQRFLSSGALVGPLIPIAATLTLPEKDPAVANVNASDRFLVVYHVGTGALFPPLPTVRARAVSAFNGTAPAEVTVDTVLFGPSSEPDVGGHSHSVLSNTDAIVVWRNSSAGIRAKNVGVPSSGILTFGPVLVVSSDPNDTSPSIAKHGGASDRLLVTWDRVPTASGTRDIYARVINLFGQQLTAATQITTDLAADEENPDCATQNGTSWMVVYEKQATGTTGDNDVACRMLTMNFSTMPWSLTVSAESIAAGGSSDDQVHPAVDFAASKYLVAWSSTLPAGSSDIQMRGFAPAGCVPCEPVVSIDTSATADDFPAIGAKYSGASSAGDQAVVVWQSDSGSDSDVKAQRVEAIGAGGAVVDLGGGCGSGGTAAVSGPAAIGNAEFAFTLSGAGGFSVMVFGGSTANLPCGPCTLVPNLDVLLAGPGPVAVPIPCVLTLVGAAMKVQWIVFAPSACPLFPFLSLSNALDVSIGT